MKRFLLYLLAVATIVACSKSDDVGGGNNNNNETPKQPEITLSTTAADFSTDGGTNVITFTSSEAWTAQVVNSRADDWCSIEPTSGPAGSAKITVTTTENDTPDDRTASIIIKAGTASKTINVSQKQKDALTVTSSKFEVSAEGGEVSIEVKANIDFEYAIEESATDWVEYKATRALKTSNLVFEVKENDDTDKREARITITNGEFSEVVTIYQEGAEPSIILTENEFAVSSSAETIAVEVKSNVDVTVELPTDADWITENTTRAFSTNTYYFDIEQNDGYDNRTAQIKFTNKATGIYEYITVTQMQRDAIVVAKDSYTVDSEGDEIVIEVGHNIDFDVEIADDWITRKDTRAFVTDKLTFVIAANKGYDNRESTIKFTSKDRGITQTVKVYQAQEKALIISKKDIVVSDEGGEVEFEIRANVSYSLNIPNLSWLHYIRTRSVSRSTFRFKVDPNTSYDSREAKIVVTNRKDNSTETITITQVQKDAIVLAKSEYEVVKAGGTLDFELQTNVDLTVTISDTAKSWITQVETRGLETKTLYFNIAACPAEENREGTITVAGGDVKQTITVRQSGFADTLEKEREALIALYKATGGDNWKYNNNWCSDKPVSEWDGIATYDNGLVKWITMQNNNLNGVLPPEIGNFVNLEWLDLSGNKLSGQIPAELGNASIQNLNLGYNEFEGEIPKQLANITQLKRLDLSGNKLSGSIPIELCRLENLEYLNLMVNQLAGTIPAELGNLSKLQALRLQDNQLVGEIPKQLGNLTQLIELTLGTNLLTGSIPSELGRLTNLHTLYLSNNDLTGSIPKELGNLSSIVNLTLGSNNLRGSIPAELGNLKTVQNLVLGWNYLTGEVPKSVMNLDCWNNCWYGILAQLGTGLSTEGIKIYAPEFSIPTIGGGVISNDYISQHKYTVIYNFFENCPYSAAFTPILMSLYDKYKDRGLGVFSTTSDEVSKVKNYIATFGIEWPCTDPQYSYSGSPLHTFTIESPAVAVYDQNGLIIFNGALTNYMALPVFIENLFNSEEQQYESTDYSKDGEVKQLQTATKGDGIDIVLMGDAYSDRLIADGTYDQTMQTAMEKFFEVEPYKSFRDHFNVYSVTAVSKNEVYTNTSETAFAGYFGGRTHVGGNDQRVFYYAEKAIGAERMDDALIVVMMNSVVYAGTCYMYDPTDNDDWGDGVSISYFPIGVDDTALAQVLHHEAGGHGFSKLGDEYAYEETGNVPEWEIESARIMATYGWWKNIDFTNDPTKVKWNHFLTDSRYTNDGLGVYEGAFTYWTGAYRPTQNSIMNTNVGGFNAPSRESIYYRIHKLAYGEDWEYDYEEFVEWDAKNRTTTRGIPYRLDIPKDFQPTHPPVVVKSSWRNAKNNAPKKATTNNDGNAGSNLRPATSNRTNQQTMSISPNRTVSSSGMVVTIDSTTGRKTIERMEIK
ncbi:MAG: redoxin domain-containing protein [Rikenellaceae bacterium]|nr:redoxin domain-containing protein [Rikenellaceae bacterium]